MIDPDTIDENAIVDLMHKLVDNVSGYIVDQDGRVADHVDVEFDLKRGSVNTRARIHVEFTRGPDRCS